MTQIKAIVLEHFLPFENQIANTGIGIGIFPVFGYLLLRFPVFGYLLFRSMVAHWYVKKIVICNMCAMMTEI